MKLVYLAQTGLFDGWAHTVQIMKMCEAFAENGIEVELIVPRRKTSKGLDSFKHNHTQKIFKITEIPFVDIYFGNPKPIFYWIRSISFLIVARVYLIFNGYDVLYTRELYTGPFFRNVFIEYHSFPKVVKNFHRFVFKRVSGFVVLTSFIKSRIVKVGIVPEKVFIAHDAVRLEDFTNMLNRKEARNKLNLSNDDYLFGYIGTLKTMGMEKGVETAILSLKFLPKNYRLYIVGGEVPDIDFYKNLAKEHNLSSRVIFAGKVLHETIPLYISACDVLVAPFPENQHYNFYMSPLKIFEYMASNKPIIATRLPSIMEVLKDRENAELIPPNNPQALADAIVKLKENPDYGKKITTKAYLDVSEKYTWNIRAKNIIQFINSGINFG